MHEEMRERSGGEATFAVSRRVGRQFDRQTLSNLKSHAPVQGDARKYQDRRRGLTFSQRRLAS